MICSVVQVKQPIGAAAQYQQCRDAPKQNDRHVKLLDSSICPERVTAFSHCKFRYFLVGRGEQMAVAHCTSQ
jgi:hypothetical protein